MSAVHIFRDFIRHVCIMQKLKRQVFFRFHRDELQINKKFKKYIEKKS